VRDAVVKNEKLVAEAADRSGTLRKMKRNVRACKALTKQRLIRAEMTLCVLKLQSGLESREFGRRDPSR
jgi:hypothetical protein